MIFNQDTTRRKFLQLLTRSELDEIAHFERPWSYRRKDLEDKIIQRWEHHKADVEQIVLKMAAKIFNADSS